MPAPKATKKTQDPTPAEFQEMVKQTRQQMNAPAKRGKKAKAAPAVAPESTDLLADFRAQLGELVPTLEPRQAIAIVLDGRLMYGAVLTVTDGVATVLRISSGQFKVPLADCAPASLVPGTGLAEGDLVTLAMRPGLWRVTRLDEQAQVYACEQVDAPDETTFTPLSGVRVVRRVSLAHTCADLGQPPAVAEQLAPSTPAVEVEEDLPFPVTAEQLDAAITKPTQEPAPAEVAHESGPILDTKQISWLPISALTPSPLNPRKNFPQEALETLANSIAAKGLMQNLVGRVTDDQRFVEVVAGGRRLRALNLLRETGRITDDYAVPVRVQEMTDLDALMLAVAENSERADVEPLEEADAFVKMIWLGASVEDIALRFKCSTRTVEKRLVLAEGLGGDARALLADGKIVISQAQVIAQTSGPLREHVITAAKRGDSAQRLRDMIASCTFLVHRAKFDVATSGLEIIEDLFGDQPARFADPQAALALQLAWVEERRKTLSKKKEQHFVDVLKQAKQYLNLPYDAYTTYSAPENIKGTVIMVSTQTGEVKQERCAREADIKSARAKEQAAERAKTASEATGSEGGAIRKSGWVDAHQARATALRTALVGDHKRTVALTILSLLQATPVSLRASLEYSMPTPIPTGLARLKEIDAKVGGQLGVNGHHLPKRPITQEFKGYNPEGADVLPYLDLLMTLTLEDLLDVQSVLIAQAVGGWSEFNPMHAPYAFVTRLAADTGATVQMKLTDAHLKAYPRDRLIELAEDAGIADGHGVKNGHISTLTTNTEIRAAILQHADALAERGYVPPLARFPEVADTAQARQYRRDAKNLAARLDGQQISSLLEDLGIDPTADTAADGLNVLQQEIDDMTDTELQDWQGLRDMAQQVQATATAAD